MARIQASEVEETCERADRICKVGVLFNKVCKASLG